MKRANERMMKLTMPVLASSMLLLGACADMSPSAEGGFYSSAPNYADAGSSSADAGQNASEDGGADAAVDSGRAWFQLSPDDSTSMASAQYLKLNSDYHPAILSHEVINYYDPPAELRAPDALAHSWTTDDDLIIGVDGEKIIPSDDGDQAMDLLIHIYAPQVPVEERRAWNLHLCVDVSGSMAGDKIAYTREALHLLVDGLRAGDHLSLTSFDDQASLVFSSLNVPEDVPQIHRAIDNLHEGGGTNMIDGLNMAYAQAQEQYEPSYINRVILFGDGSANVGDTDLQTFASLTRINNKEGIYLSGVGVGSNYAVERMDALTDAGKGAHVFLPNRVEVGVIFGTMLRKLVEVADDDISIEVSLPGSFYVQRFSGEEMSTDPDHRVPNVVLAAGDDMTLLTRFQTSDPAAFDDVIELTVRYRSLSDAATKSVIHRVPLHDLVAAPGDLLKRTKLIDRYARWAAQVSEQNSYQNYDGEDAGTQAADDDENGQTLRQEIVDFAAQDPGLEEIACLINVLDPQSQDRGEMSLCVPDDEPYPDGQFCVEGRDCGGVLGCVAMPASTGLMGLLGLVALFVLRRRRQ